MKEEFFFHLIGGSFTVRVTLTFLRIRAKGKAVFFFDLCRCSVETNVDMKLDSLLTHKRHFHCNINEPLVVAFRF